MKILWKVMNASLLGLMHKNNEKPPKSFRASVCTSGAGGATELFPFQAEEVTAWAAEGQVSDLRAHSDSYVQWPLLSSPWNVCPWPRTCRIFSIWMGEPGSWSFVWIINGYWQQTQEVTLNELPRFMLWSYVPLNDRRNVSEKNDPEPPSASNTGKETFNGRAGSPSWILTLWVKDV